MPVVTLKKQRATETSTMSLMAKVQQKTETILDGADRVLVVYEASGSANIYYEGGGAKSSGGAN